MILQKTEKYNIYDKELTVNHALRDIDLYYESTLRYINNKIDFCSAELDKLMYSEAWLYDMRIDNSFDTILSQAEQITIIKSLHEEMKTIYKHETDRDMDDDYHASQELTEEEEELDEDINGNPEDDNQPSLDEELEGLREDVEQEEEDNVNNSDIPESAPPSTQTNTSNTTNQRRREAEERRRRRKEQNDTMDEGMSSFIGEYNLGGLTVNNSGVVSEDGSLFDYGDVLDLLGTQQDIVHSQGTLRNNAINITVNGETIQVKDVGRNTGVFRGTLSDGTVVEITIDDPVHFWNRPVHVTDVTIKDSDGRVKVTGSHNEDGSDSVSYKEGATTTSGTYVKNGQEMTFTEHKSDGATEVTTYNTSSGTTTVVETNPITDRTTIKTRYTTSDGGVVEKTNDEFIDNNNKKVTMEMETVTHGGNKESTFTQKEDGVVVKKEKTTVDDSGHEYKENETYDNEGHKQYEYTYNYDPETGDKVERYYYANGDEKTTVTHKDGSSDVTTKIDGDTKTEHYDGSTQGGDSNTD